MGKIRWPLALGLAMMAFPGCAFVSTAEYLDKVDRLDQDGDGDLDKTDCADHDPERSTLLPEVPLNGIDENCDGVDAIDLDCDGYPTISRTEYEGKYPIADFPEAIWPVDVDDGDTLDCDDGTLVCDCDGTEENPGVPVCFTLEGEETPGPDTISANTYPGASDAPYDGVDADCAGNDDFDRDGDGYVRPEDAASSDLPAEDCDDTNKNVHGGDDAPVDEWYDGIDSDCDKGNDFDQDGDGYLAIGFNQADLDDYREYYDYTDEDVPDALGDQDCVDGKEGEAWTGGGAEDIHPDATDDPYDGVDSDCAGDNDFDVDGDGYIQTEDEEGFDEFLAAWDYSEKDVGYIGLGDCDDDGVLIYPGRSEILGDEVDQDCDGLADWSPLFSGGYTWAGVSHVVAARNGLHFLIAARADWFSAFDGVGEAASYHWPAAWLAFNPDTDDWSSPAGAGVWHNAAGPSSQFETGARIDIEPDPGAGAFYGLSSHIKDPGSGDDTQLYARRVVWTGSTYLSSSFTVIDTSLGANQQMNDLDIEVTDDGIWMLGCADSMVAYHHAQWDGSSWTSVKNHADGLGGLTCRVQGVTDSTASATLCDGSSCTLADLDSSGNTITEGATTGGGESALDRNNGWMTTVHTDGSVTADDGQTSYDLFDADTVYADAAVDDTGVYAVAVRGTGPDGANELWFGYGEPGTADWSTVNVEAGSVVTTQGEYTSASIAMDEDRVFVAASVTGCPDGSVETTQCDRVYWTFLDKP